MTEMKFSKAKRLLKEGKVQKLETEGWYKVKGNSEYYLVNINNKPSCDCQYTAYSQGKLCSHIIAAILSEAQA